MGQRVSRHCPPPYRGFVRRHQSRRRRTRAAAVCPTIRAFVPWQFCARRVKDDTVETRQWYERLYRLLPDIHFDLRKITVSGGPWNTIVVIEWDETNSGTDNVRTYNRGIHVVHLRWGRATKLIICPDTIGLMATLERLKAAGNAEALAAPIVG